MSNLGQATCRHCGATFRLFTIFNRSMDGLCKVWKERHERGCAKRTPKQRRAWARPYVGLTRVESSITVELGHPGFADPPSEPGAIR